MADAAAPEEPRLGIKGKGRNRAVVAAETTYCLDKRLAGVSIRQIALDSEAALGHRIGRTTVERRISDALKEHIEPRVTELRAVECARCDHYLSTLAAEVDAGDPKAINAALRVAERRAKLLGLDAPVKIGLDATVRYTLEGVDIADLT